jgi:hypothetical protein
MNPPRYQLLVLFWTLCILTGCQRIQDAKKDEVFSEMFPNVEMNTAIQFWDTARSGGPFKIGKSIDLVLDNFSPNKIVFPSDYGFKIYTYDENQKEWLEIKNKAIYFPAGNRQISPKGNDMPGVIAIGLAPALQPSEKPINIRVVVVGTVYVDEQPTSEEVGAYIDLELSP